MLSVLKCRTTQYHPQHYAGNALVPRSSGALYQLAGMDWIDVLDALKADPGKPPNWRKVSPLGRNHPLAILRRTKPPEKIC